MDGWMDGFEYMLLTFAFVKVQMTKEKRVE